MLDASAGWSVVQCESQREGVAEDFLKREGFEVYLPRIRIRTNGRARVTALFPSYIFGRIGSYWWRARWSIGVLGVLMSSEEVPAQLPDKVIDEIRRREGPDGLVRLPKQAATRLRVGQPVKIIRGAFETKLAIFDNMSGHERCAVLLEMLGQFSRVELPVKDVEPCLVSH